MHQSFKWCLFHCQASQHPHLTMTNACEKFLRWNTFFCRSTILMQCLEFQMRQRGWHFLHSILWDLRENLPLPPILSHAHVTTPQTWCRNIWATSDHHVKKTYTKNWCTGNSKSTLIYKKHFNPIKCRKLVDDMRVSSDCKGYKIMYFLQHISTWLKKK